MQKHINEVIKQYKTLKDIDPQEHAEYREAIVGALGNGALMNEIHAMMAESTRMIVSQNVITDDEYGKYRMTVRVLATLLARLEKIVEKKNIEDDTDVLS